MNYPVSTYVYIVFYLILGKIVEFICFFRTCTEINIPIEGMNGLTSNNQYTNMHDRPTGKITDNQYYAHT